MKRLTLILLLCLPSFAAGTATAQDTKEQENRRLKLQQEIEIINGQLKENSRKSNAALSDLSLISKKLANRNALIADSDREIASLTARINVKEARIDSIRMRTDTLMMYCKRLVLSSYKNRDTKVWYMYVFASENLGQALRRMAYFKNLSSEMSRQVKTINEAKSVLEAEKEKLVSMKAEAEELRQRQVEEKEALMKEEKESKTIVNRLKKNETKYRSELSSKKKQVEALNAEITKIIKNATKGSGNAKDNDKTEIDMALDAEFANNKGKLPWPANGAVIEQFGQHYHPVFKRIKLPFNNGITIALSPGTPVKASFDGVVKQIVVMPGYNKCVLIQHGNYFTFYCKLDSTTVKAGEKVKTGDVLGTVWTADGVTQLHFQVWQEAKPQDPELWLKP